MNKQSLVCWLMVASVCPQVLLMASTVRAAELASRITDIKTTVTNDRLHLLLSFASSDRPQITYNNQGKAWVANLSGANLQLANGNATFAQTNPAPGISSVEAVQAGTNKVQVRITTTDAIANNNLVKRSDAANTVIFSVATNAATPAATTNPNIVAQTPSDQQRNNGTPLFQPKITITPDPNRLPATATPVNPQLPGRVQGVVPPFQRRPVPPPVGDISVSTVNLRPDIVDLGSAERVPRISLRDAPVRDVLTLIARVAGLNVAFSDEKSNASQSGQQPTQPGEQTSSGGPKISLDIENETAQEVFNNVLRLTNLDANRIGRTIFVAAKLPNSVRNIVTRSYRLNQISVPEAANFLVALGAERSVVRVRAVTSANTVAVGTAANVVSTQTTNETTVSVDRLPDSPDGTVPLLRGLQVIAEERGNSITLVGSPSKVEVAAAQLARLDVRKRQVAVNVRVVDVNLLATQKTGNTSSFGINDTFFSVADGVATVNFGATVPASQLGTPGTGQAGRPIVQNPYAGTTLFVNPDGTQSVRDPVTGALVKQTVNQPGSPFSSDGNPLTPGISGITSTAQLPDAGTTGTAARYYLNPGGQINATLPGLNPAFKTGAFANTPLLLDPNTGQPIIATAAIPAQSPTSVLGTAAQLAFSLPQIFQYPRQFLSQLNASITNGNAKILTDPTLTVQEGETATVSLVQEVSGGIIQEFQTINGQTLSSSRVNIRNAGLTLNVKIDRVDENGFINMSVAPVVSAIGNTIPVNQGFGTNDVTLLTTRSLTSGQIRLRDNQTLILSGVIQDSDRETVKKVPFFADLPIIGALFRSTTTDKTRSEVIIIVTPKIINDSENSQFGYTYQPGPEVQKLLDNNGTPFQN